MYLLISHYTRNRGTTDYICDYLEKQKISYLYLRHPLTDSETHSELIRYNGTEKKVLKTYKKSWNFIFEMFRNIFLSLWISITQIKNYSIGIGFGGFNVFPILYTRLLGKKVYFWGVDYSTKRFGNSRLNKIYFHLETLACIFSNKIISSSERQREARINFHKANNQKSIVIHNGFTDIGFQKDFFQFDEIGFLYIGSITHQHGILDFIQYFYIEKNTPNSLYIIGGGELENELIELIHKNNLGEKVKFLGRKNQNEIIDFLNTQEVRFFGIAPYNDTKNDHVFYGDSIKVREYLGYNVPFIISDIPQVGSDIKEFGVIYKTFKDISIENLENFSFNTKKKNEVLKKYTWNDLLNPILNNEIKIFIINMNKDVERYNYMEKQLQELQVNYNRFEAIDGKKISANEKKELVDEKFILSEYGKDFTYGEIGCALSHYNLYRKIVSENIGKAIIFEDDVEINMDKFSKILKILKFSSNYEYVSLNYSTFDKNFRKIYLWEGTGMTFMGKIKKGILIYAYRPIELLQEFYGYLFGPTIFHVIRPLHLAGCYYISCDGAKKIIATQGNKIRYLADYVQNEARKQKKLKLHFISPQITYQANEKFGSNTR